MQKIKSDKNFTITNKLLVGYLGITLLMISIVVFGYQTATKTANIIEKSLSEDIHPLVEAIQIQEKAKNIRVIEGKLTEKNDISKTLGIISEAKDKIASLSDDLQIFLENHFQDKPVESSSVKILLNSYIAQVNKTISYAENAQLKQASDNFRFSSNPRFLVFIENFEDLSLMVKTRAEEKHSAIKEDLHLKRNIYLFVSIFFSLTGLMVVLAWARSLSGRIAELRQGALEFSKGNFDHTLKISGNDEITEVAKAFNVVKDSLQQKMLELTELNEKIYQQNTELESHREHLETLVDEKAKDLLQSDEMIKHFQKMESLGTLAGGVAHDFNNLLHGIAGYAQLLQIGNPDQNQALQHLQQIESIAHRGSELVQRIMAFSRKGKTTLGVHSLEEITTSTLQLLERIVPKNIDLQIEILEETLKARVDHSQLEQVLINMVNNAVDAMPEGGIIRFSIAMENSDHIQNVPPENYATISITDSGTGMDDKVKKRIFDPFYTTKDIGKGTGLGLSSASGIIKNLGGYITCESTLGVGSTFCIYLPICFEDDQQNPDQSGNLMVVDRSSVKGIESILIVDDEKSIRDTAGQILRDNGYTTVTAEDGQQALKILHNECDCIDLVITDIGMPGMSGSVFLKEIRSISPGILIIVCSGYLDHEIINNPHEFDVFATLKKPFNMTSLLEAIQQASDKVY